MGEWLAQRLQSEATPRPEATCRDAVAKFAPWWGFAFYALIWAALAVTLFAMIPGAFLERIGLLPADELSLRTWALPAGIALVPTMYGVARWVVRRRMNIHRLARDGSFLDAHVVGVRASAVAVVTGSGAAKRAGRVAVIDVPVRGELVRFGGYVSMKVAATLGEGQPVRVLAVRDCRYVIVIAPSGEDFLAKG